jgi:hypothetical protein
MQIEELLQKIKFLEKEIEKNQNNLEEANYKLQNYQEKVRELNDKISSQQRIIETLEEQLRLRDLMRVESIKKKDKDLTKIDLLTEDYSEYELLLNKRNWTICEPWLIPLKRNNNNNINMNIKLNLLYKASRDGFSHLNFKEKCLGKANTLTVVLTEYNKLIGGFTPLKWRMPLESHEYDKDESKKTFLFSLNLGKKFKLTKPNYAICQSRELGPIFGGGNFL